MKKMMEILPNEFLARQKFYYKHLTGGHCGIKPLRMFFSTYILYDA